MMLLVLMFLVALPSFGEETGSPYTAEELSVIVTSPEAVETLATGGFVLYEDEKGVIREIEPRKAGREITATTCSWQPWEGQFVVDYYIHPGVPSQVAKQFFRAWERWRLHFPKLISRNQEEGGAQRTVEIKWAPLPGSPIGTGHYPCTETSAGNIVIDSGYQWNDNSLFLTLLHELGHTFGLQHNTEDPPPYGWWENPPPVQMDVGSIMYFALHGGCTITWNDQVALRRRYPWTAFRFIPPVPNCPFIGD